MTTPSVHHETPAIGEVAGRSVVLHYGAAAEEYGALRRGAMLVNRSHRTRTAFSGAQAAATLAGLVTNDVEALTPGHGQYAAALTAKGKIIADVRILAFADHFLVDVPPRAAEGWWAMVRKFVNPRLARYGDETETRHELGVYGVTARRVVADTLALAPDGLAALPLYGHLPHHLDGEPVTVVRVPDLGLEGYVLLCAPVTTRPLWERLVAAGATPAGLAAWDIARIEAGRPEWGIDIDDTTIAQEANLDELHAISYTKGCYTGQETVARVHFRGHVNRHLRGIRFEGDPPAARASLSTDDGKLVGDVRSVALSPRLGGIGLAMVRREVEPGGTIRAGWEGGATEVTVVGLPHEL